MNSRGIGTGVVIAILVIILIVIIGLSVFYFEQTTKNTSSNTNQNQMQMPTTSSSVNPTPSSSNTPSSGSIHTVNIQNFAFTPGSLIIKKGDTVIWINLDSAPHTVTTEDNALDSGSIEQGQSFSHTFYDAGTYNYHCTFHVYMKGAIIVQ